MRERFNQLENKMNDHIELCRSEFERINSRNAEVDDRIEKLIVSQQQSTEAMDRLTEATRGVVEVYNNVNGAIKVGTTMQRFLLWVLKWPVLGAAIFTSINYLGELLSQMFPPHG